MRKLEFHIPRWYDHPYCCITNLRPIQVFYDDESRNREVERLGMRHYIPSLFETNPAPGVTFVLVPDGVDNRIFEKGLETWRKRHPDLTQ